MDFELSDAERKTLIDLLQETVVRQSNRIFPMPQAEFERVKGLLDRLKRDVPVNHRLVGMQPR